MALRATSIHLLCDFVESDGTNLMVCVNTKMRRRSSITMTKDTGGTERDEYLKVAQGRTPTMRQQWNNNGEASEQVRTRSLPLHVRVCRSELRSYI